MSCGCCTITALTSTFNCGNGVTLDLSADTTGTWKVRYRFNGNWITKSFSATAGEDFELPDIFMENYIYLIQLLKPDGTVFNDVCYSFSGACGGTVTPGPTPRYVVENFPGLTSGNSVTIAATPLAGWPVELELNGIPDVGASMIGTIAVFSVPFDASSNGQGVWLATVRYWTLP